METTLRVCLSFLSSSVEKAQVRNCPDAPRVTVPPNVPLFSCVSWSHGGGDDQKWKLRLPRPYPPRRTPAVTTGRRISWEIRFIFVAFYGRSEWDTHDATSTVGNSIQRPTY